MWIYFNDSMLSVVKPAGSNQDIILVRSRIRQDILRVFPDVEDLIESTPQRDYPCRVRLSAQRVSAAVANRILTLNYDNVKASVTEPYRHNVYGRVYLATRALQYMEEHD